MRVVNRPTRPAAPASDLEARVRSRRSNSKPPQSLGKPSSHADRAAHALLLTLAVLTAWFPVEVRPWTAVAVAAVVLVLGPWAWARGPQPLHAGLLAAAPVVAALGASGLSGWDSARAAGALGLVAAATALAWLASRSQPSPGVLLVFAVSMSLLAVWGLWQVTAGRELLAAGLDTITSSERTYAVERLASGRAFASLPLPSHLAVLLATALPLLVARIRSSRQGVFAGLAACSAVLGLALTRSPVGIGLALLAVAAVLLGRQRRLSLIVLGALVVSLAAVVVMRPDVARLDPIALRLDNWRTALWLWSTAPSDGVGLASFAQATQAAPLVVGNRPAHAHSLPLEALGELGPVGLIVVLVLAAVLLRLAAALWPRDRALAVALLVVPAHNLVDFSLFVTGVAFPWAVLVGWGLATSDRSSGPVIRPRGRPLVVLAASGGLALASLHATSVVVERAAATASEAPVRFDGARRALALAPWRVEPQFLLAAAALESGDASLHQQAWRELDRRRCWRPRSAALAERRAQLALSLGDPSAAVAELWGADELGAADPERASVLDDLLTRLDRESHDPAD